MEKDFEEKQHHGIVKLFRTLWVKGNTTFNSAVTVVGTLTVSAIALTGNLTITGNVNITGNLDVTGDITNDGQVSFGDTNGTGNFGVYTLDSTGTHIFESVNITSLNGVAFKIKFPDLLGSYNFFDIRGVGALLDGASFRFGDINGWFATGYLDITVNSSGTPTSIFTWYGDKFIIDDFSGSTTRNVAVNGDGLLVAETRGIIGVDTTDVSNPPTDAELDGIWTSPATVGAGFTALLDDNGAGTNVYLIASDGTNWWHLAMTKAV